jgi:hypothetical protein
MKLCTAEGVVAMFSCDEILRRIESDYSDADVTLNEHIAQCSACREYLEIEQMLRGTASGLRSVTTPTDFTAQVLTAWNVENYGYPTGWDFARNVLLSIENAARLTLAAICEAFRESWVVTRESLTLAIRITKDSFGTFWWATGIR